MQCEAEIARLEGICAAATRRRAAEGLADLHAACEATRLAVPRLPEDAQAIIASQGLDVDGKVPSRSDGCCTAYLPRLDRAHRSEGERVQSRAGGAGSALQRHGRVDRH